MKDKSKEVPPVKQQIHVPTQKTFIFDDRDLSDVEPKTAWTSHDIDKQVNEWLLEMTLKGQQPMLGKVTTSPGIKIYVFLFTTKVDPK